MAGAPATPLATGTVTGRVVCSDTNLPARFASVVLQPVVGAVKAEKKDSPAEPQMVKIVQTGLDGSFVVPNARVGEYYVVAEKAGYRSPTGQLTREQMDHPTEAIAKTMAELLTPVSVAANRTSTVEVRLLKGASLAGTVRFDDGTPDGSATLKLWRRDEKGKWAEYNARPLAVFNGNAPTDDRGQYRFSGLPAGEYLVSVQLEVTEMIMSMVDGRAMGSYWNSRYDLQVYADGSMRQKEAKRLKLTDGQDASGVDIEVPVSKMHAISGRLAEEGSGRRVNAGKITLVYADDGSELASGEVDGSDELFHLSFVPEGEYTLKVTGAREVTRTEIPNDPGTVPPTHTDEKVVKTFGEASQPLVVTTDVANVVVSVPAMKTGTAAAQ